MQFDQNLMQLDQKRDFPLSLYLAGTAVQEEVAALVQFAFFRHHLALLRACAEAAIDLLVLKGTAFRFSAIQPCLHDSASFTGLGVVCHLNCLKFSSISRWIG
jgi:short subunit dehydrogenase-like uncharacterized protein